jgi:S1-C subfamily serine protease
MVTAAAVTLIAAAGQTPASPAAGQSAKKGLGLSPATLALVRAAVASTGLVLVRNANDPQGPRPRGSAVIVRPTGIVATNHHVIANSRTGRTYDEILLALTNNEDAIGTRYRLRPLLINKEYDLALLGIEATATGQPLPKSFTFPTIEIGDSSKIKLLEDLFIIGFPEKGGTSITVNRGVVEGQDLLAKWIKTDARVIHGNSGGAAVNSEGKLIGIPTKVVADDQPVDIDGDGFPDDVRRYGAVGFLRPSSLLLTMIKQLDERTSKPQSGTAPAIGQSPELVTVRGVVRSSNGTPIAGALVGLLSAGETTVSESTLLTWGSTNAQGRFTMNRPVPAGRYTVRAKAIGSLTYTSEVDIKPGADALTIEMLPARDR